MHLNWVYVNRLPNVRMVSCCRRRTEGQRSLPPRADHVTASDARRCAHNLRQATGHGNRCNLDLSRNGLLGRAWGRRLRGWHLEVESYDRRVEADGRAFTSASRVGECFTVRMPWQQVLHARLTETTTALSDTHPNCLNHSAPWSWITGALISQNKPALS